jgi:hypothetical protein
MIWLDRTKRVKEARDEAKKEIDAYRKQKDEEFKKFEAEVCHPMISDDANDIPQMQCKIIRYHTNVIYSIQVGTKRQKKTQTRRLKYR